MAVRESFKGFSEVSVREGWNEARYVGSSSIVTNLCATLRVVNIHLKATGLHQGLRWCFQSGLCLQNGLERGQTGSWAWCWELSFYCG